VTIHIGPIELVFVVLVVATALSYLARRIRIAEPIMFLLGGVILGFVPGLPTVELEPDLVFLLFLPPILFAAAYFTPIRDFRSNARPILLLAVGLVLFTTAAVGLVTAALVPGLPLAVAITLGAIVAPPDAVAATAVLQRLGVPRRVVTILEGAGGGGIVVGAAVGIVVTRALYRTGDPTLEIVVSLIAPMAAYLTAEAFGVSGVLAVVVAGLITGRKPATVFSPDARLLGTGAWQIVIWAINAFVFMLIGLQLPSIVDGLGEYTTTELVTLGVAVSLTVIVVRIAWVYPATYLPRFLSRRIRERDPYPPPRAVFVVAWAGMRGVVSLAAALALAADFPERDLILFLTFCVIVATLVGQGLTLPWIVRRLGLVARDGPDAEEAIARRAAVEAAQARLDELEREYPGHRPLIDQLREQYAHAATHVQDGDGELDESMQELVDHRAIRDALLDAERRAVIRLRDDGAINDETLRRVERDLDLEALRSSG
jgi:CPA1 family monovalent cation:H+ antiporter